MKNCFQFSGEMTKETGHVWFVQNAPAKITAALGKNHCTQLDYKVYFT